jgi:hypothetical protein
LVITVGFQRGDYADAALPELNACSLPSDDSSMTCGVRCTRSAVDNFLTRPHMQFGYRRLG